MTRATSACVSQLTQRWFSEFSEFVCCYCCSCCWWWWSWWWNLQQCA